ncbi:MAG: SMP-30/gluconolactonase/LRE family protein [Ideonella sp.]
MRDADPGIRLVVADPCQVGESPMWHPHEHVLYWCDIPACHLHRLDPRTMATQRWDFETDVSCCAPTLGPDLLLAMRDGIWRFDPASSQRERVAGPPYDMAVERFNDGKCDPHGRFWIGTIYEPRRPPLAAIYCLENAHLERRVEGITVSNGLAWSPDGRTMYCSDTTAHRIDCFDFDRQTGALSARRVFAQFPLRQEGQKLDDYGGRPDGAAVDAAGCYWAAMFEGARVLRLSPSGEVLREVRLPVQCPTMVCFGGGDLHTLYITTASHGRPPEELEAQPWAGCVLSLRVDVPGLPADLFAL